MTKLWGGRFEDGPADALWELSVSTAFDQVLLPDDCAVLARHAQRLADAGLLSPEELKLATEALERLATKEPSSIVEPQDEDIHSSVERVLLAELPEIAPKLRAGLSRNDRVASAFKRYIARTATRRRQQVFDLIEALVERATEHAEDPMPGYTHLQRAQPVTLGHHLLAHAWALTRDAERIAAALSRARTDPLGAGALAGSSLPLLPVDHPTENSLDAVAARDHVLEVLAAYAICGVTLSRLAEEVVLWTTSEFAFATLDDRWATGSSLMPQKKNPDIAELARGKTGRLIGDLTALLVAVKGLPLAYNRDLQEDKEPYLDADRTLAVVLPAMTGLVGTLSFDLARLREAASDPMLFATDLAEALVISGIDFRSAHELVGEAVQRALHATDPREALLGDPALTDRLDRAALEAALDLDRSLAARTGSGPASVRTQIDTIRDLLSRAR